MSSSTPATQPPVLRMAGVAFGSIRDTHARLAERVDWTVEAGDYWVVAGLQGSGKTDFLMMTGGLMAPVRGSYELLGEPMPIFDDSRLRHRLRLGLVFDGGQLFNHLTVSENLALPLCYHRNLTRMEAEPEVRAALEATDLTAWADSTPGAIGRNWQKRVGLARALMLRPEVLLVDNPLAGLDVRHAAWWLRFLARLSQGHPWMGGRPVTLIVTAADLRPWQGWARQFAVLKDGRLVVLGTWSELEANSDEQVRELLTLEDRSG